MASPGHIKPLIFIPKTEANLIKSDPYQYPVITMHTLLILYSMSRIYVVPIPASVLISSTSLSFLLF